MRTPSLLALALALLAAGCGGGKESPAADPETQKACGGARRTLEAYLKALKSGDCSVLYGTLSWRARQTISLEALKKDYAEHQDRYRHLAEGKVETLHYDDFRVVAKLVDGDRKAEFVSVVPEDGEWRIEETGRNIPDLYRRIEQLSVKPKPAEPKS